MDEGRLGFVHRQENKHRKFNVVMNDVIKSRWETYDEYITKEKLRVDHRFQKSKMLIRRALVRQKVLQRCLKLRQETVNKRHISPNFGKYGGKPLVAFSRDIDAYIADNHPKMRRFRKIRKLIDDSIESGAILDENRAYQKVQTYFKERLETMGIEPPVRKEKKQEETEEKKKDYSRYGIPKLPALLNPFMVSQTIQADGKVKEQVKVKEVTILNLTSEMENLDTKISKQDGDIKIVETTEIPPSLYKSKSKGTLRLPPIQPTKALVQKKNSSEAPNEDVRDSSSSFPVKNNCIAVEVNSHKTELVCCTFEDRIFCIVTQYQKLGMLVDVTREIVMEETDTAPPRYSTRVLLGKDEPMTHVLAQTLISKLDIHKPIILAMALKDTAPSSVKKLAEYLTQLVNT